MTLILQGCNRSSQSRSFCMGFIQGQKFQAHLPPTAQRWVSPISTILLRPATP